MMLVALRAAWGFLGGISGRAWAIVACVVAVLAGAAWLYHRGGEDRQARLEVKAERQHAQTVADARQDERAAQASSDRTGAKVARSSANTDSAVAQTIKETHDVYSKPSADPDPVVDLGGLSAPLDRLVEGAGRAADAADAARRAGATGAP